VGGGGDRDGLRGRLVAGALERGHQAGIAVALDRAQIEARPGPGGDRTRDDVAWGELVDEALAAVVEQRRTRSAQRLGEQKAVVAVVVAERRRVELHELEVGQGRACGLREQETVAHGAAGVRGPRPERGVAPGREDDGGAV